MTIINNTESLQAGIQSALMETWRQDYPVYAEQQKVFLHYLPYTNIRSADYSFKNRIPFPLPYPYGDNRIHQSFKDVKITVKIFPYQMTIGWDERDAADDQMADLKTHVSQSAKRFLQLPDVLIGEYLGGTAVYNYSGLLNASDGVGLYSTVDGDGAARFGVTGGNVITGQGVNTTAKIHNDIINCRRRFLQMTEPVVGQPLHDPDNVMYNRMCFVVPPQLDGVFNQLSDQDLIYSDPTINTAQSNFLKSKIKYKVNQRLADTNDWFVVLESGFWKPFAYRAPQTLRQLFATMQNSDISRETMQELVYADLRIGISPWCPWTTIQVSNS